MNWVRSWLPNNSTLTEQETTTAQRDDKRNFITAQESDVDKELEHGEMQLQKMQRQTDEQGMVIYGLEQGSSSNSQLSCDNLVWLSSYDSAKYPKIVTLKEKMSRLFARRRDILTELEHAEFQPGKKRREEVHHWLILVQGKYDEIRNVGSSSNSNLPGCIERFIKEVDDLIQTGQFPNGLVLPDQESTRLPLYLEKEEPVGINFKRNAIQILEWLKNHEHSIIGVCGMGGVGKTTLLLHIHDQLLEDPNLYGKVYWVTVSQNCTVQKLQEDIAKVIGVVSLGEDDERKRAAILHNKLVSLGASILILDDMWVQFLGEKVGIPLEGSSWKLIISTRQHDVCLKMGCKDYVIKVEALSNVEAWGLFVDKLGHYDKLEEEAKKLAKLVAQKCACLPLAIKTMATSMRGVVDIHEWKNVLNELKCRCGQDEMNENVLQILQFSYDRLKEERDKNCFLSCVLYGEDEEIKRDTLIEMWINEGLFDEIESWEHQVTKGHSILNKLESWSLLESCLDYKKKRCVKMHDLVRYMAISITQKHPRFIAKAGERLEEVPNEEQWSKDLVKVSLSDNYIKEIPSGMAPMTPNLTVLMLNWNEQLKEIPESFFRHMKALKVLDLSDTSIDRVPHSVSGLVNLKALLLLNCMGLTCVPESFFKDMKALQVLDLSYTSIIRVPESVSDLEHLRKLLLKRCHSLEYVPSVEKLRKLQVLDLSKCFELKAAPKGLERLKSVELRGYCPWDISDMRDFNKFIIQSSWSSSRSYQFWIRDPTLFTSSVLVLLYDDHFYENRSVMIMGWEYREEESCWMLPKTVEYLGIEKSDFKGRSLRDVFPRLDEATNLEDIILDECSNMKVVFPFTEHPPHLPNLNYLRLSECEEVEEIFQSNERASQCVSPPQSNPIILSLPNLKELELDYLPQLKAILSNLYIDLPNLQELILVSLPKLKLPITKQLHLPNLKILRVEDCEEVEEIFQTNDGDSQSNPIILSLPNLVELNLYNLPKLEEIFQIFDPDLGLPNFERLTLEHLPKLKWVFPFTEHPLHLVHLKRMKLLNCSMLHSICRGLILIPYPSVGYFRVENCPKLKRKVFQLYEGSIIVDSKSTIECILNNTQFWEKLQQDYPDKARLLSHFTKQRMELWQGLDDDNDDGGVDGDGAEGDGDGGGGDGDGAEGDGGGDGDGTEGDGGVLVLDDDDRTTWGASLSLLPF